MTRFSVSRILSQAIVAIALVVFAPAQTFTTFDVPNSLNTVPQSNNLLGQITGYYQDTNFVVHGFMRQKNGSIVTFDPSGSIGTYATSNNLLGQISGYYQDTSSVVHGFLREKSGSFTTFDAPNSPYPPDPDCEWQTTATDALSINLSGQIAGVAQQSLVGINGITCSGLQFQGFLRDRDGTIVLFGITFQGGVGANYVGPHSINLPGQIAGWYQITDISPPIGGFLREPDGTITTFLGDDPSSVTHATAINLFGQVTGSFYNVANPYPYHGFLRQPNGSIVTFDPAGSAETEATSINDLGQITGYYLGADNAYHGFLRQRNGVIATFDVPGAGTENQAGTFPTDINLRGQITGYYQDGNFVLHGFVRTPQSSHGNTVR